MVAILILNWNGWEDTIACLKSLSIMDFNDYFIILGDNGSDNDSKDRLAAYCKSNGKSAEWLPLGTKTYKTIAAKDIILYDLKTNNGFAKGNNLMMKFAYKYSPDYYLLLNNDTEVKPDFLSKLVYYQKRNPQIKLLSPLIYYYEDKDRIWNAGGKIIWGVRKYFYSDHLAKNISVNEYLSCSFITGCALMFVPDILKGDHTLFTEAFFHGEEDFELSLRMKKKRVKMGCYTPSVIYHKVGRSSGSVGKKIGLTYCYYLNRFINLRHNLSFLSFYSFLCVYLPYVVRLLHKNNLSYIESFRFYFKVVAESHKLDEVTHEKFMECVKKTCI